MLLCAREYFEKHNFGYFIEFTGTGMLKDLVTFIVT